MISPIDTIAPNQRRRRLFLDIVGVLLRQSNGPVSLARGADSPIEHVAGHFDCYQLLH
jgi:hypothetical protein